MEKEQKGSAGNTPKSKQTPRKAAEEKKTVDKKFSVLWIVASIFLFLLSVPSFFFMFLYAEKNEVSTIAGVILLVAIVICVTFLIAFISRLGFKSHDNARKSETENKRIDDGNENIRNLLTKLYVETKGEKQTKMTNEPPLADKARSKARPVPQKPS
jgi:beta-lactamase regulating signal transducer with metallopeptidase domain